MSSRPATLSTATSWGAPSYSTSPALSEFRADSPDLDARMLSAPSSPLPFTWRERALDEDEKPEEERSDSTTYRLTASSTAVDDRLAIRRWRARCRIGTAEAEAGDRPPRSAIRFTVEQVLIHCWSWRDRVPRSTSLLIARPPSSPF